MSTVGQKIVVTLEIEEVYTVKNVRTFWPVTWITPQQWGPYYIIIMLKIFNTCNCPLHAWDKCIFLNLNLLFISLEDAWSLLSLTTLSRVVCWVDDWNIVASHCARPVFCEDYTQLQIYLTTFYTTSERLKKNEQYIALSLSSSKKKRISADNLILWVYQKLIVLCAFMKCGIKFWIEIIFKF